MLSRCKPITGLVEPKRQLWRRSGLRPFPQKPPCNFLELQGHPERMRKVKRSPWTLNLGPMKTVLLFFFLDDDDPVLQVGLELRDYESESGRKQSFSYDVS